MLRKLDAVLLTFGSLACEFIDLLYLIELLLTYSSPRQEVGHFELAPCLCLRNEGRSAFVWKSVSLPEDM